VDTNVVSDADKHAPAVSTWLGGVHPKSLALSVVTVGEIEKGIQIRRRRDAGAAQRLQGWLDELRTDFADRILPVDERVAIAWAGSPPGAAAPSPKASSPRPRWFTA
jgi:predicted nucleic acid-binding protein